MGRQATLRHAGYSIFLVVCLALAASSATAFSLLPDPQTGDVVRDLETAARWSPEPDPFGYGSGFHDGLQVAVAPDFADELGVTDPQEVALLLQVIRQAFAAWETPELWFDVDFERVPVRGINREREIGWEFDLFAVAGSDPVFADESYFGLTRLSWRLAEGRLLANGQRTDGRVITAVDIFVNTDLVLQFAQLLTPELRAKALQRLLMHEIGHGLGLGHPNTYNTFNANYDTDFDPSNVMVLDPADPFAALLFSEERNARAILSNDRTRLGTGLYFTELQNDDRGGRDALYPSVEPCPGDCSGDARVDVAELVTVVNVALGEAALDLCYRADLDRDGYIRVDELLRGVNTALTGCVDRLSERPGSQ